MPWLVGISGLVIALFGIVLLRGAPYLPTLTRQVDEALDLIDLKPGQTLLELGCGDGKVLIAAAKKGLNVVGYELNPILALIAWVRTRKYKGRVKVIWGDFWNKEWPHAEGIFIFLLDSFMEKLDTKVVQYTRKKGKSVKLVSYAFQIPNKKFEIQRGALFFYHYK